jgi:hypothetical protein
MTGAWLGRPLNCFHCLGDWFFESNSATIRIEFDHFMIQNSPDARKLLTEIFVSRSSQSWDATNRSGISPHY